MASIPALMLFAPLTITNVTLIDGSGRPPVKGTTVVVDKQRIVTVGKPAPAGSTIVDGAGKFLIPGLWDMHVHLSWLKASALPLFVANGVTGVRDMGGHLSEIDGWRARIFSGALDGPRIYRAGPTLNGKEFNELQAAVPEAAEMRGAVRALARAGVDFLKIHRATTRDAFFALAEESKRRQLRFAGHIPQTVTPEEASDAGQLTFEHMATLFEGTFSAGLQGGDLAQAVAKFRKNGAPVVFTKLAKNGTAVTPTLVASRALAEVAGGKPDPLDKYTSAFALRKREEILAKYRDSITPQQTAAWRRELKEFIALAGDLQRAGVQLLAGTDAAVGYGAIHAGFSIHEEMQLLVEGGLTPLEALQTATRNPARILGANDMGTIEAGKVADLVLLYADPLADIRNTRRIAAVFANGRHYDRAALARLLAQAEAAAKRN